MLLIINLLFHWRVKCCFAPLPQSAPISLKIKCFLQLRLNARDLIKRSCRKHLGGCMLCKGPVDTIYYIYSECSFFVSIWRSLHQLLGVLPHHRSIDCLYLDWRVKSFSKYSQPIPLMLMVTLSWSPVGEKGMLEFFLNEHSSIIAFCGEA